MTVTSKALPSNSLQDLGSQREFEEFIRSHRREVGTLVDKLTRGTINQNEFGDEFYKLLRDGHEGAWRRGRWRAGDLTHSTVDDFLIGRGKADQQSEFLRDFLKDLENDDWSKNPDGSWRSDRIKARGNLYIGAMRGTANESFVQASDDDDQFDWVIGGNENHCDRCPELARLSPWDKGTLFAYPGSGDTPCLGNCKCHLERHSDGKAGFRPVQSEIGAAQDDSGEPAPAPKLEPDGFPSADTLEEAMTPFRGGVNDVFVAKTPFGKYFIKQFPETYTGPEGELAAKEIADAIGWGRVIPNGVLRDLNGEVSIVQSWVDAKDLDNCPRPEERLAKLSRRDRQRFFLFDYVIGNFDRHSGNYMLNGNKLVLVDHERAFAAGTGIYLKSLWEYDLDGHTDEEKRAFRLEKAIIKEFTSKKEALMEICRKYGLDYESLGSRIDILSSLLESDITTVGGLLSKIRDVH